MTSTRLKARWHIRYEPRHTCDSFALWAYHEWGMSNRHGINEAGIRIFGVTLCNWNDDWANPQPV